MAKVQHPPYFQASELLLSVSGGLDSMVLLDVFWRLAHIHGSPLRVLHVCHHTGTFANLAQHFVTNYCEDHGITAKIEHFHWDYSGNFEYKASNFRKKILEKERRPDGWILLAHHLQDQTETFFQAMTAGAGITSPLAMNEIRDSRLRPFLSVNRTLLIEHALTCEVPHLLDPSNDDLTHFRNKVRHDVLPNLNTSHNRIEERIGSWLNEYHILQQGVQAEADRHFEAFYSHGLLPHATFKQTATYLWPFLLKRFWEHGGLPKPKRALHHQILCWLAQGKTGTLNLKNTRLYCDLDGLILWRHHALPKKRMLFNHEIEWGPWSFILHLTHPSDNEKQGKAPTEAYLNAPKRIPKRIKEVMRAKRIPLRIRQSLPNFEWEDQSHHFFEILEFEKRGLLTLTQTRGNDLKSQFL